MRLTVVGCGDAFGSGGRLQTCYHVALPGEQVLIDCGSTAVIGMQHLGLDPDRVSTIFISHLHGDHFAGLVWFLLHAHYVTRRTAPLTVTGPAGIAARFTTAAEALFPGSTKNERRFEMRFLEYEEAMPLAVGSVRVTPYEVSHPSGAPPYALRLEAGGKILSFSGDTEWVESLLPTAKGADLFIAECFSFDVQVGYHMTWRRIETNLDRLGAKRVMLTHMSAEMLARREKVDDPRVLLAEDGLTLDI
ncbi:MAG TPA: MBL fold metallo-hydrolase [Hyphomicrobium sp.]|jgi:ribonuclease BN (tRNA processing enzyme)